MPPKPHREGEGEWLFLRFYDFEPGGLLTFNVITLQRAEGRRLAAAGLAPRGSGRSVRRELAAALAAGGLRRSHLLGRHARRSLVRRVQRRT